MNKEINRMNEENTVLLETHLNSKNIISNFSNENGLDNELIEQLEESNTQIRDQLEVERTKISEARNLIKLVKQELIQVSKEKDIVRA